uniref:Uncharacterized protein n=1 Tax=Strombidium inclinatum TaxID=197538 RepID=A0A7S3IS32_9SPIT
MLLVTVLPLAGRFSWPSVGAHRVVVEHSVASHVFFVELLDGLLVQVHNLSLELSLFSGQELFSKELARRFDQLRRVRAALLDGVEQRILVRVALVHRVEGVCDIAINDFHSGLPWDLRGEVDVLS